MRAVFLALAKVAVLAACHDSKRIAVASLYDRDPSVARIWNEALLGMVLGPQVFERARGYVDGTS